MRIRTALLCAPLSLLLLPPTVAAADPVRQIVPYSGHLDFDGQPFNGTAQMRFRLYTAADAPVAEDCAAEPACVWEESKETVRAYNGAFAVRLGESDPERMAGLVSQNTQYWLEMALRNLPAEGAEPDPWVSLTGRQAITPAPQALWTASASTLQLTGLTVDGHAAVDSLDAAGAVSVGGHSSVNTLGASGAVTVDGQLHVTRFGDVPARRPVQDGDGAIVVGEKEGRSLRISANEIVATRANENDPLLLNPGGSYVGVPELRVGGVTINGFHLEAPVWASAVGAGNPTVEQNLPLGATAGRFCFLTRTRLLDLNDTDEVGLCEIIEAGGQFVLRAAVAGGAGRADCTARCVRFQD